MPNIAAAPASTLTLSSNTLHVTVTDDERGMQLSCSRLTPGLVAVRRCGTRRSQGEPCRRARGPRRDCDPCCVLDRHWCGGRGRASLPFVFTTRVVCGAVSGSAAAYVILHGCCHQRFSAASCTARMTCPAYTDNTRRRPAWCTRHFFHSTSAARPAVVFSARSIRRTSSLSCTGTAVISVRHRTFRAMCPLRDENATSAADPHRAHPSPARRASALSIRRACVFTARWYSANGALRCRHACCECACDSHARSSSTARRARRAGGARQAHCPIHSRSIAPASSICVRTICSPLSCVPVVLGVARFRASGRRPRVDQPRIAPSVVGRRNRFVYTVGVPANSSWVNGPKPGIANSQIRLLNGPNALTAKAVEE